MPVILCRGLEHCDEEASDKKVMGTTEYIDGSSRSVLTSLNKKASTSSPGDIHVALLRQGRFMTENMPVMLCRGLEHCDEEASDKKVMGSTEYIDASSRNVLTSLNTPMSPTYGVKEASEAGRDDEAQRGASGCCRASATEVRGVCPRPMA
eukprot:CAMPEP_0117491392 /NCGR_PEP_ID=MMETSP0784-20121206/18042_1 /TAXON_ID=39447 /ORGANISM="" /LENGTH=150 /DNA_ID=CAMNT_0005286179 /DNA_START=73 /DNA_END=522 /DNA_ORIENTATION=+